jgi:hypothetical protein
MPATLHKSTLGKLAKTLLGLAGILFAVLFIVKAQGYKGILEIFQEANLALFVLSVLMIILSKLVQSFSWFIYLDSNSQATISPMHVFLIYNSTYATALIAPVNSIAPGMVTLMFGSLNIPFSTAMSCWLVITYASLIASSSLGLALSLMVPTQLLTEIPSSPVVWIALLFAFALVGLVVHLVMSEIVNANKKHDSQFMRRLQLLLSTVMQLDATTLLKIIGINSYLTWSVQVLAAYIALRSMSIPALSLLEVLMIWGAGAMASRVAPGLLSLSAGQLSWALLLDRFGLSMSEAMVIGGMVPFLLVDGPTLILGFVSSLLLTRMSNSTSRNMES